MEQLGGRTGFVRPTFEEYPNRFDPAQSVSFYPHNADLSYTADDLMQFFADKEIGSLVVVNPDNPSGSYIPKADLLRLCDWAAEKGIRLVIDESFVDFADEPDATLIRQEILDKYPRLYVMKSISKSYGVPGLRLGVLASGDTELIAAMKKDVAIWNINSFGEFYMQIAEKYNKDYETALVRFRAERSRFAAALSEINGLRVIPSQANYFTAELTNGMAASQLTKLLLVKHSILIKDLSKKLGGGAFIRIAIRGSADNDRLTAALKTEMQVK